MGLADQRDMLAVQPGFDFIQILEDCHAGNTRKSVPTGQG